MPREIVIVSRTPPDLARLIEAGNAVDPELGLRTLFDGAVHQICQVTEDADIPVLSVNQPLSVDNSGEISRLLSLAPSVNSPLWWVEAVAPWGETGLVGVAIAREFAARLDDAECVLWEGR